MRIDRAYLPVETLGPGKRIVLWTCGCSKGCQGCANPELWDGNSVPDVDEGKLAEMLLAMSDRSGICRLTITGGDPLEQPTELLGLLRKIRPRFTDILIYTGYEIEEVKAILGSECFEELAQLSDALIDGPYIESMNDGECALMGSTNQQLHLFCEDLREEYERALAQPRKVQNVTFDERSLSIGIHGKRTGIERYG